MTLSTNIPVEPSNIQQYGIQVTIFPADDTLGIIVWRAPDNGSGAPNDAAAVVATQLPPSPLAGVTFIDPRSPDGVVYYYKSQHIDAAGVVSTFTSYSDGQAPGLLKGAYNAAPMAAFGEVVDALPPNTRYAIRFASNYLDPEFQDGIQTYIDLPATTNFMRLGHTPLAIVSSTNAAPIVVTITGHGYVTGDAVTIRGHLVNTNANGTFTINVIDANSFSLTGSTGNGVGGATGHSVKLSLTVDSSGNLVVYALIRAVQLIVNGLSTFNGILNSLAGALFRSLQHSTAGSFGDTTINRVMLENNNIEVWGDAGTGTNNEVGRIGSHTVQPSGGTLTSRSSKTLTGQTAGSLGWVDPDGVDDGVNSQNANRGQTLTIAAANRLLCKLGDPTNDGDNVDAYDDKYTVQFKIGNNFTDSGHDSECDVTVQVEVSTDQTNFSNVTGASVTLSNLGTGSISQVYSLVCTVAGAPAHVWFRLAMTVSTVGLPGTPSGNGTVQCFSSTYRTNNYAVTWTTSSGSTKGRRNLKLFATSDGTDQQPHAYLAPISAATPNASLAEGEVEFVGSTMHGLAWMDDEALRYITRTIDAQTNKTSSSTSDVLITANTAKLKAGRIDAVGRIVRIRAGGTIGANTGTLHLRWGTAGTVADTSIKDLSLASSDAWFYDLEIIIQATGTSGTARVNGLAIHGTTLALVTGTFTINTTVDTFINITGLSTGPVTITVDAFRVDHKVF